MSLRSLKSPEIKYCPSHTRPGASSPAPSFVVEANALESAGVFSGMEPSVLSFSLSSPSILMHLFSGNGRNSAYREMHVSTVCVLVFNPPSEFYKFDTIAVRCDACSRSVVTKFWQRVRSDGLKRAAERRNFRLRLPQRDGVEFHSRTCSPGVRMPPHVAVTRSQHCTSKFLHKPQSDT